MCCEMYNALLESWKGSYAWWVEHRHYLPDGARHQLDHASTTTQLPSDTVTEEELKFPPERSQSKYDLFKVFTQVRKDHSEWTRLHSQVGRGVISRFDRSVSSFYQRCKKPGKKPGYPRFKPRHRWRSIEIPGAHEHMLIRPGDSGNGSAKWWRLSVKGLRQIRFEDKHDRIATAIGGGGRVLELRVARSALRVEVHVVVKHPSRPVEESTPTRPVGIDKGLKHRVVTSDGHYIPPLVPDRRLIKRTSRSLNRAKRGSKSRLRKRQAHAKAWRRHQERAIQADFRLAHWFTETYDAIVTETSM